MGSGSGSLETSTDLNGRLDLTAVPTETQQILLTLWDGTTSIYSGLITLPARGSRTIDMRGNRTVSTTMMTYADFGFAKLTEQDVQDCKNVAPSKADAE
jgi:hypothetical protein